MKRDIKNMVEEINVEELMTTDIRTFSLNVGTTKVLDEISEITKINKTKLVSLFINDCFERYSIKDVENLFKNKLM